MSSAALFLRLWTYNDFEDYMVSRLFRAVRRAPDSASQKTSQEEPTEEIKTDQCCNPIVDLIECYPWLARFCKRLSEERKNKVLRMSREKLLEETSIFKII